MPAPAQAAPGGAGVGRRARRGAPAGPAGRGSSGGPAPAERGVEDSPPSRGPCRDSDGRRTPRSAAARSISSQSPASSRRREPRSAPGRLVRLARHSSSRAAARSEPERPRVRSRLGQGLARPREEGAHRLARRSRQSRRACAISARTAWTPVGGVVRRDPAEDLRHQAGSPGGRRPSAAIAGGDRAAAAQRSASESSAASSRASGDPVEGAGDPRGAVGDRGAGRLGDAVAERSPPGSSRVEDAGRAAPRPVAGIAGAAGAAPGCLAQRRGHRREGVRQIRQGGEAVGRRLGEGPRQDGLDLRPGIGVARGEGQRRLLGDLAEHLVAGELEVVGSGCPAQQLVEERAPGRTARPRPRPRAAGWPAQGRAARTRARRRRRRRRARGGETGGIAVPAGVAEVDQRARAPSAATSTLRGWTSPWITPRAWRPA